MFSVTCYKIILVSYYYRTCTIGVCLKILFDVFLDFDFFSSYIYPYIKLMAIIINNEPNQPHPNNDRVWFHNNNEQNLKKTRSLKKAKFHVNGIEQKENRKRAQKFFFLETIQLLKLVNNLIGIQNRKMKSIKN